MKSLHAFGNRLVTIRRRLGAHRCGFTLKAAVHRGDVEAQRIGMIGDYEPPTHLHTSPTE